MKNQQTNSEPSNFIIEAGEYLNVGEILHAIEKISKKLNQDQWLTFCSGKIYVSSQALLIELRAVLNT